MKKEVQFKRQFNPNYKGTMFKNESGKSMTKPDLNMSIRQLMTQHTRGINAGVNTRQELYEDDIGGEVPVITDMNDIQDYKEQLTERAKELEQKVKEEKKAAEAKRQKAFEEKQKAAQEKNQQQQQTQQQQQKE